LSPSKPNSLERALEALLLPVVRLALKRGLAFGRFSEIVKRAYVAAARRDFAVPDRKLSVSRVAVLTGMTRKEASRLMQDDPDQDIGDRLRKQVNRAARVVTAWVEDETYHDGRGAPASLPFESEERPSFCDLVADHGADVGPRAVLDELMRVGAVGERADGRIHLVERVYIPSTDEDAKLDILGTDVADLVSAIDHNLDPGDAAPFFQRKVAYDNLPSDYLPRLRAHLAERGQAFLEELNADMATHDRDTRTGPDDSDDETRSRAMIGIYYYEEPKDDDE
jgi:Family of unknown function (DUF6502)